MNSNPALHTNCEVLKEVIPGVVTETLGEALVQPPLPARSWVHHPTSPQGQTPTSPALQRPRACVAATPSLRPRLPHLIPTQPSPHLPHLLRPQNLPASGADGRRRLCRGPSHPGPCPITLPVPPRPGSRDLREELRKPEDAASAVAAPLRAPAQRRRRPTAAPGGLPQLASAPRRRQASRLPPRWRPGQRATESGRWGPYAGALAQGRGPPAPPRGPIKTTCYKHRLRGADAPGFPTRAPGAPNFPAGSSLQRPGDPGLLVRGSWWQQNHPEGCAPRLSPRILVTVLCVSPSSRFQEAQGLGRVQALYHHPMPRPAVTPSPHCPQASTHPGRDPQGAHLLHPATSPALTSPTVTTVTNTLLLTCPHSSPPYTSVGPPLAGPISPRSGCSTGAVVSIPRRQGPQHP